MTRVLVTGGNGQLAKCIRDEAQLYTFLDFSFLDVTELDVGDSQQVNQYFEANPEIKYCINCAAYTNVDNAENEKVKAITINSLGAKNIASACNNNNVVLLHISTDFVFNGNKNEAYTEQDITDPISVYGHSKLGGENEVREHSKEHFIIRTSWLYSQYGNNFMKTMLRLAEQHNKINVVCDQIGTPTFAGDLSKFLIEIILSNSRNFGTFHYSNQGESSWYDFAISIFKYSGIETSVMPIKTEDYPSIAKRPIYSVLSKDKIFKEFKISPPYWKDSLKKALVLNKIKIQNE